MRLQARKNISSSLRGHESSHTLLLGGELVWPLGRAVGQSLVTVSKPSDPEIPHLLISAKNLVHMPSEVFRGMSKDV